MTGIRRGVLPAAALGVACGLVAMARHAANPTSTSDTAVIETFTYLASERDLLLGPYSRFQWHHPGPIYFFWLAPFYVLSGVRTAGLNAGALALNLLVLAVAGGTLVRRASRGLALGVLAGLALLVWRTPGLLVSPWNPHIPVFTLVAFLVVAADAMSGALRALPLAVVLASVAGQTHVALLPLTLAVGCAAVVVAAAQMRRSADGVASPVRIATATVAVALLAWGPSLVEHFSHSPGNLGLLWTYFVSESRPGQTFDRALSAWADMLAGPIRPDFYVAQGWRFVESPVRWAEALSCVQVVALVAFGARAWRRQRTFDLSLAVLLVLASMVALWSATRIEEEIFDHAVFWMSGIGALNLGVIVALILGLAEGPVERASRTARMLPAAAVAVTGLALLVGVRELRTSVVQSYAPGPESVAARAVADDVQRFLSDHGIERPVVHFDQEAWGMVAGVVLQLQKAGVAVAVEDDWIAMYTPAFSATGREPVEIWIVGSGEHVRLSSRPGDRVISSHGLLFAHAVSR